MRHPMHITNSILKFMRKNNMLEHLEQDEIDDVQEQILNRVTAEGDEEPDLRSRRLEDYFIIAYPQDSDLDYKSLAVRIAEARPGEFVALSKDEMLMLDDFRVWPKQ